MLRAAQDHPDLAGIGNLTVRTADVEFPLRIPEPLRSLALAGVVLPKGFGPVRPAQQLRGFHRGLQAVEIDTLGTCLLVEAIFPIQEAPAAQSLPFPGQVVQEGMLQEPDLPQSLGGQILEGLTVTGGPVVVQERRQEQERIVEHHGAVGLHLRLRIEAAGDLALRALGGGEEIEAAAHQVHIPVGLVIGQGLHPQVAQPQATVPLGAVLENILHARPKGPAGDPVQMGISFRTAVGSKDGIIRGGHRLAGDLFHDQAEPMAHAQDLQAEESEGIASGEPDPGG